MGTKKTQVSMTIAALLVLLWITGSARAYPPADEPPFPAPPLQAGAELQYQGRLTNPITGEPVTDDVYSMSFRLYDVESSGSPLWAEIKDVSVQSGLFSTVLGDTTSLNQSLFDGQALWLGIKVGADAEATPRQQVLPVAYALSLVPGAVVEANSSATVLQVNNTGSGNALSVEGPTVLNGNLNVSGSLIGGSHTHSGADITSGTVAEVRIDSAIARDGEIMPTVLNNDGAGSGLDADLLDGQQASAFASVSHKHTGADIVDGSVTSDDIKDYTRLISFPANALSYNPSSTIIQQHWNGLLWQASYQHGAYLMVSRPTDWDGTSDVEMHLYFYPTTSTSGKVDFFIRPRAYDPGDTFADATSLSGSPVPVSQSYIVQDNVITIPASRFGSKRVFAKLCKGCTSGPIAA